MTIGGIVGAVTLITGSQIPLAVAVGWIGLSLIRLDSADLQSTG